MDNKHHGDGGAGPELGAVGGSGGQLDFWGGLEGFPIPGQQRVQVLGRGLCADDTLQHVGQPGMRSTAFSLAVWISVMAIAQCCAPPSDPANKAFLRLWKVVHNRNYVQNGIMRSLAGFGWAGRRFVSRLRGFSARSCA